MTEILLVDRPATNVPVPALLPLMSRTEINELDRDELIQQLQNSSSQLITEDVRTRLIHQDRATLQRLAFQVWRAYQPMIHKN